MVSSNPTDTNDYVESLLDARIRDLEATFDADALAYSGLLLGGVDDVVRSVIETKAKNAGRNKLIVLLTTFGGYIEPVTRIVETLRHHYEFVEFIVPSSVLGRNRTRNVRRRDSYGLLRSPWAN